MVRFKHACDVKRGSPKCMECIHYLQCGVEGYGFTFEQIEHNYKIPEPEKPDKFKGIYENSSEVDDLLKQLKQIEEKMRFEELKNKGIIANVALVVNPKNKGVLEEALYSAGIKRIPVIYTPVIEEDKILGITDKEYVERIKETLCFSEEVTEHERTDGQYYYRR